MAMVEALPALSTAALREEVMRLEQELKFQHWHEQQLAISDGCALLHPRDTCKRRE